MNSEDLTIYNRYSIMSTWNMNENVHIRAVSGTACCGGYFPGVCAPGSAVICECCFFNRSADRRSPGQAMPERACGAA